MKTLIIAEAGVNHNGDMNLAKNLIDVAAYAGADLVKFQTFSADRLVTPTALKAEYQIKLTDNIESQHSMLQRLELSEQMHYELIAHCAIRNIGFFSTGFDIESIDLLHSLGQKVFKIPSGEITNLPYLRHIGELRKDVILSTGMSTMYEIESALNILVRSGTPLDKITVLQCTSAYPTPIEDVNLRAMKSIQELFNVSVGYSDHTLGIEIPIAAVALGASVIEKHFTMDRNLPGPDHKASLEPSEFIKMVAAIRKIETALGDGVKRLMPSESMNIGVARKTIVAKERIIKGEMFTETNLSTKRSGEGLSPMLWDSVIGKFATREYLVDEQIEI
jgi:N,N'-diacetyllegionaminate synthase